MLRNASRPSDLMTVGVHDLNANRVPEVALDACEAIAVRPWDVFPEKCVYIFIQSGSTSITPTHGPSTNSATFSAGYN
jgi:hypothetical protein